MKKALLYIMIAGLLGLITFGCSKSKNKEEKEEKPKEEQMSLNDQSKGNPVVTIKTSKGDIKLTLNQEKAPVTVANFIDYAKSGHYNNTIFHRVIDGFMIQGGGFTKDMKQKAVKDPINNEAANGLKNKRGTIAMARTSEVNSATSQFFINVAENSFLDHKGQTPRDFGYCVFGEVTEGMDVIEKIKDVKTSNAGIHQNVPVEPVEILEVTVS